MAGKESSALILPERRGTRAHPAFDRRRFLGWTTTLGASFAVAGLGIVAPRPAVAMQPRPPLVGGHTWLLASADALRPEAPGDATDAELQEVLDAQAERTDDVAEQIRQWGGRQAVLPWLDLGMQLTTAAFPPGLAETRAHALLRTVMSDAVVAALDAQEAFARSAPSVADERVEVAGRPLTGNHSFPSVHAAVAGAASTVLAHLFPEASPDGFAAQAQEAATSRIRAGASYRSDIEVGLAMGQAIGELAIAHGQVDGSDAVWDGSGWPTGNGLYQATPPNFADPLAPLAGTWDTWVLSSGDAIRPDRYPAFGSFAWHAEQTAVRRATERRTLEQERVIDYWLSKRPSGFYTAFAQDMIERENVGEVEAANIIAMTGVAQFDALVAVWDAKYAYWIARPSTMNAEMHLYIPDPAYPAYPGGFAAACSSAATVLADAFPAHESELMASAWEGAAQRCWCGIHYVLDNEVGLMMGSRVGRMTVDLARSTGG